MGEVLATFLVARRRGCGPTAIIDGAAEAHQQIAGTVLRIQRVRDPPEG